MEEQSVLKEKSKRGGYRPGAGRPRKESREIPVNFVISNEAKERLESYAKKNGLSMTEAANKIFLSIEIE